MIGRRGRIGRWGLAAALAAVALGCIGLAPSPLQARPEEQQAVVSSIEFQGRMNVEQEPLLSALALKPGDELTSEKLEADRKALLGLGYFRSVGASQRLDDGKATVTFRLTEWPKVSHVRVLGNTLVARKDIQEVISTQLGQVLCAPQLQDDIRAIERLYRERGYVARISDKLLDQAFNSGILRFEVVEARISEVRVEGGSPDDRERARRALHELPPAFYRPDDVTLDQRRLLRLPRIRQAVPKAETDGLGKVRIVWTLTVGEGR